MTSPRTTDEYICSTKPKPMRGTRNVELKFSVGITTFHDVLVQAREILGDNKVYFDGNVDVLAKPLREVEDINKIDGIVAGYEDETGSIVSIGSVNTMVVNRRYDAKTGRHSIDLHPLFSIPSSHSYIGNRLAYSNSTTNSLLLQMKSMKSITSVRYISRYNNETVLKLDSKTLGVDLNDATARHIVAYIEKEFELKSSCSSGLHLEVNGQLVAFGDSLDSLLREWAPRGGTVTVLTRPDLKDLLHRGESRLDMEISVRTIIGKTIQIKCFKELSVGGLKRLIEEKEGIHLDQQRLVFEGKQLEDNLMLGVDYNMQNESTVHLILRLRGGMFHSTSGRQDFRGLDLSDKHNGRQVSLLLPDGSRTTMNIRARDSLTYLKGIAMALVEEANADNNQGTKRNRVAEIESLDQSLELSVRRIRSLLFSARREHENTKNALETEQSRMNREGARRETLEECIGNILDLRSQLLDQNAQIKLLSETLIEKEMELEESEQSAKSEQPPTKNRE